MRHGIAGNTLNRKTSHRKATVRDIAKSVLIHEKICTTKAKAKEARKLVDQLITMGKKEILSEKRRAFAVLCDHKLVSELFKNIAPRFKNRVGGYTRIIHIGTRRGDNAELVYLELTEKKEIKLNKVKGKTLLKQRKGDNFIQEKNVQENIIQDADFEVTESEKGKSESKGADAEKGHSKKDIIDPKKGKIGNKISGIRKFFNKKSSGDK